MIAEWLKLNHGSMHGIQKQECLGGIFKMAASNHRLELEAYYLIILVAIRMRRKRKKELQRRGKEKEEVLGSKNIPETAGAWSFSHFSVAGIVRIAQCGSYMIFQIETTAGIADCRSLELP